MNKIRMRKKRRRRIRGKIFGTKEKPRLSVYRSNKYIYGQLVNDQKGETIVSFTSKELKNKKKSKIQEAQAAGEELAKRAKEKKIKEAVFDRGGYKYHGRVQAFAKGARKGGLNF